MPNVDLPLPSLTGQIPHDAEMAIDRLRTRALELAAAQEAGDARIDAVARGVAAVASALGASEDADVISTGVIRDDIGDVTPFPAQPGVVGTEHLDLVVALNTVSPGLIATPDVFTQQIVSTLHNGGTIGAVTVVADANWGRRLNPSGILSTDVAAYLQVSGSENPFSVDIILGATGPAAAPAWNLMGRIGGAWRAP